MSSASKEKKKTFINWNGRFGRFLNFYERNQKWWLIFVPVFIAVTLSYDVGQMVARSDLWSGSQNVKGNITVSEALSKSELGGGRLLITSNTDARFIDVSGQSWNIGNFAKTATQSDMDKFAANNVGVDGSFTINVRPVKTKPNDLLLAVFSDFIFKFAIVAFYVLIIYFGLKYFVGQKKGRFKKVEGEQTSVKIADVAGYEGPKQELVEVVDYLRDPERFSRLGARPPKGVLLYGPPGSGKTLLAKALAGEAAAYFYEQSASSFVQVFAGEGAKSVRQLFEQARKTLPAVIFIDEIDAVGGSRSGGAHDERVQTLNAILTEMDGFENNEGIIVVAATNRLEVLDEALVRPGRFDRKVYIGLPGSIDREKILQIHGSKIKLSNTVDWKLWAAQTKGFSGASLAALVNEAAIEAAREHKDVVDNADIAKARDRVWIGAKNQGQILSNEEREIVAVHEMGHALMRLKTGGRVEKVSIEPRGQSLGVTVAVMDEEKYLHSMEDIENEILVLMGGRAAEKIMFGRVTGGATDDMQRASQLARNAAIHLGSERWGAYVPSTDNQKALEDEAAKLVNNAFEKACEYLLENKNKLKSVSDILKESDEINEVELLEILSTKDTTVNP